MFRTSRNLPKAKTNRQQRFPQQLGFMPYRRREHPVVRGFDGRKAQWSKEKQNALQSNYQFSSTAWKFGRIGHAQGTVPNVRLQGYGGDESSVPNREKMWDTTWGELDVCRREFITRKEIADRKLVPKLMVPDWRNSKFRPYVAKTAMLDQRYIDLKDHKNKPVSARDIYDKHIEFENEEIKAKLEEESVKSGSGSSVGKLMNETRKMLGGALGRPKRRK